VRGDASVTIWGSGTPRREFLYSDDTVDACVHLMNLPDKRFVPLLGSGESVSGRFEPPLVNIGMGEDLTIAEFAQLVREVTGLAGDIVLDRSKAGGTPRKLMDVWRLADTGWRASTPLAAGLRQAYRKFLAAHG
jgi:GDP-L-fucose synthase